MTTRSREQMVSAAADMLARGGYARTSVRALAQHGGTPLGSTYHHFPAGKSQLTREAVAYAGGRASAMLEAALSAGPGAGLRELLAQWRRVLVGSEFEAGCPVLSVAVTESRGGPAAEAVEAARAVFSEWEGLMRDSLLSHGASPASADSVAALVVCAVEGSVGVCRAERSTRALDSLEPALAGLIERAITQEDDA